MCFLLVEYSGSSWLSQYALISISISVKKNHQRRVGPKFVIDRLIKLHNNTKRPLVTLAQQSLGGSITKSLDGVYKSTKNKIHDNIQMQDRPNNVDEKLTILQRLAEKMSKKADKLYNILNRKHLASFESFPSQKDQTRREYKTSYGKFEKFQSQPNPPSRANHSHLMIKHHEDLVIEQNNQYGSLASMNEPISTLEAHPAPAQPQQNTSLLPANNKLQPGVPNSFEEPQNRRHQGYINAYRPPEGFNSGRLNDPPYPPQEQQLNQWDACSCVLLWLALSHLLGGIGMVIYGSIQIFKYMGFYCPSPYTKINGNCCSQEQCLSYGFQGQFSSSVIVGALGIIAIFLGIFLLKKTCKMYKNNNDDCCPDC